MHALEQATKKERSSNGEGKEEETDLEIFHTERSWGREAL